MGLINAIGSFFRRYVDGFTFGDQTRRVSLEQNAVFEIEVEGNNNVQYDYEFQPKSGIVAHLDDIHPPVRNIYTSSSAMIADQSLQETNYIYYVSTTDIYYEYLGTTLGNINDYNPVGGSGAFVPYIGAKANVNLGEYGLTSGFLTFDTTPTLTPTTQGTMYWDAARETVALIMNGSIQHVGHDVYYHVKNSSGALISKGRNVRFAGTDGASGHILIEQFIANGSVPSSYYMGVTAEDIPNGEFGKVIHFGELEGFDTSIYPSGSLLYASTTVAGAFQTTAPVAPNNIILVAATLNSKNNGEITIRPTLGSNINTDEGVKIVSPSNNDVLLYKTATGLWENATLASISYVHPTFTARNVNFTGAQVLSNFTSNTEGHVTNITTRNLTLLDLGYTGATNANFYVHPSYTLRAIDTSGAEVIDTFTSDASGHVTGITLRTLTLLDLGYTGASNADNYNSWLIAASGTAGTSSVTSGSTVTMTAGTGMSITRTGSTVTFTNNITQYTDALARAAISLTTTGTSGVATYSSSTGVLNIPNYTYTHASYTARSIDTTGAQIIDIFTSDAQGHVTNITTRTLTLADLGYTGATDANNYIHPTFTARNLTISGATVLATFVSNTEGHVTGITTRTLTLADLGYTGATNANNYVHPAYTVRSITLTGATVLASFDSDAIGSVTSLTTRVLTTSDISAVNISLIGAANGVASLDVSGKVPLTQLPDSILGQVTYVGTWNASTNSPTLPDPTTVKGDYYIVTVAGSFGGKDYNVGDWIISDGTQWDKVDNTDSVSSVFGRTGNVVANASDYAGFYVRYDISTQGLTLAQQQNARTNINAQITVTGGASTVTETDLTINRALISNGSGKIAVSTVTSTELGYLSGVTSNIQTQLNTKLSANQAITLSGDVTGTGSTSIATTISNNVVTDTKLRQSVAFSVIGRSTGTTGNVADIVAAANQVLRRDGTGNLIFGTLVTANIGDAQVTYAKIQNVTADRLLGRLSTTGVVQELTAAQIRTFINVEEGANLYVHPTYTAVNQTLTGATVVSTFTTDTLGSVTGFTTRSLTAADISAVPTTRTLTFTTNNGLTGGSAAVDLSANRSWTFGLTGQALALHNLATSGIIVRTGAATVTTRTITAGTGITVTNGDGVSGNPVISLANSTFTKTAEVFTYAGTANFTLAVVSPLYPEVFLNGVRLVQTLDWTIAGNVITVTAPLDTVDPDEITITYYYNTPDLAPSTLTGTGTVNFLTKWSSVSGLTSSQISDNGTLITLPNSLAIGGSLSTITYSLPLSIALPAIGTKAAFLNVAVNSVVKVELNGSENGHYQPITLTIYRNSTGAFITINKDNPFFHEHSNDIAFSSDTTTGNIFAEKILYTTARNFRISKVEVLFGTASVLNGSLTTTTGVGVDQSVTRIGRALYITGANTVAQGNITGASFIRTGGLSTQFLKADGSVDSNVYALNSALASYVPTTRTITINGTALDLSANRSWSVGTVTSVALSGGTTGLTVSGSPITGSGTITLAGTLIVANGGTGATTLTGIVVGNGTSAMTAIAGTASQLLRRNSGNTAYEFFTHDFVNQAGARSAISLTTTGTSGVATYSSATGVLNIPNYTYTHPAYTALTPTLTGANVLATFTTDATGHVTAVTTRVLTAADIGAQVAGNYVTLDTAQTITGVKTVSRNLNISRTIEAVEDVNTILSVNTRVSSGFILNGATNAPISGNLQYANIGAITFATTDGSGEDIYIRKLYSPTNFNSWRILWHSGNFTPANYGLTTADITAVSLTTTTLTLTRAAGNLTASVPTFNQNTTGSAATLTTSRNINGTAFNGSSDITTANWGTARTITIGATGKSVNGSANVSWTLDELQAEYRVPVNTLRNNLGDPTVREMALFHGQFNNKFRFIAPTLQEESIDGVNWTTSSRATANALADLMIGEGQGGSGITAIPSDTIGNYGGYRLTWNVVGTTGYIFLNAFYFYNSTNGNNVSVTIEAFHNTNGWIVIAGPLTYSNWPGHTYVPHTSIPYSSNPAQYGQVRVTFSTTHNANINSFSIGAIEWFGGYPQGRRNVESYDRDRNVTFPAAITGTRLISTVVTGTAPFTVTSTSRVTNLNVSTAGTADVWTTARTITIGSTGKSVDGSANVSWSLAEIGAEAAFTTLSVAKGGTGASTLTGVLIGNGTSAVTAIVGAASQLLRRNAGNTAYEFFTHDFVNQAGARSAISLTTTGTSGAATYSSATGVLNIPNYSYTLPTATSTVLGGVELFSDTVQTVAANAVTTTASRTYGIQLNSSAQMVVNIPWTDTVYAHPTFTAFTPTLSGANVLATFTTNTNGHVTAVTTRTLTAADIGAAATSHTHAASAITAGTFGSGNYIFPGNIEVAGQVFSPVFAHGTSGSGSTITFNWNESNIQTVTLTGNCSFFFINPQSGGTYQIIITQDGTGNRTITWITTIKWKGGAAPALTGTANSIDIVTFTYDGTSYYGTISKGHA